jgi:hypothetical protein
VPLGDPLTSPRDPGSILQGVYDGEGASFDISRSLQGRPGLNAGCVFGSYLARTYLDAESLANMAFYPHLFSHYKETGWLLLIGRKRCF